MYPNIDHIFLSTMPDHSDVFLTNENPDDEDVSIKPDLQFQNHHFQESNVPKCSQSSAISGLVILESSTRLENSPISDLKQSWFTRRNNSHKEKKKEGGERYEAAGPLLLLLSKENYKLEIEEQEEEEEDGFRTPTSLDHRIPEVEQCPPAPIKPKPHLKRKASHIHNTTSLCLSSKDLQLVFPVQHNSQRITKKVRRDNSKH